MARGFFRRPRSRRSRCPPATATDPYRDTHDLELDIANLKAATARVKAEEVFMSAASPGVISVFLANHHYRRATLIWPRWPMR